MSWRNGFANDLDLESISDYNNSSIADYNNGNSTLKSHNDAESSPPKKLKVDDSGAVLSSLSAAAFASKLHLFTGSMVSVHIDDQGFSSPKALLCYNSAYFKVALNSNFKEGLEQEITIDDIKVSAFKLAIQWIYLGRVNLGDLDFSDELLSDVKQKLGRRKYKIKNGSGTTLMADATLIERYMEFFQATDYLQLVGPFDAVYKVVMDAVQKRPTLLTSDGIRAAMDLPSDHPVRVCFIEQAAKVYVGSNNQLGPKRKAFRYQDLLDESDQFAAEVLRENDKMFKRKKYTDGTYASVNKTNFSLPGINLEVVAKKQDYLGW